MSHIPVNHPLRPLYRVLSAITALYVLLFGIVGMIAARGTDPFARIDTTALGLRTNLAFSVISVVVGVVILISAFIGRNVDRVVYLGAGVLFMVAGTIMMLLLHTDSNFLNFSIATCIVSYIIGIVLFTAGLYAKVGPVERAAAEEAVRHAVI